MYVTPTVITFDPAKLVADTSSILAKYKNITHINLRRPDNVLDTHGVAFAAGPIHDTETGEWLARESDFNTNIEYFKDMYIREVIDKIEMYAKQHYNLSIGRARLLTLRPKSLLLMHSDPDNVIRFHVPIITNNDALFIHRDNEQYTVSTMKDVGRMYTFNSSVQHTAINASQHIRTHLVVVGH